MIHNLQVAQLFINSKVNIGINRPEIYYYLILYSVRTETATNHAKQSGIFGCWSVLSEAKLLRTGTLDLRYHSSLESEFREFKTVMCEGVLQNGINCILAGLTVIKRFVLLRSSSWEVQSKVLDKAYVLHLHILPYASL